MIDANETMHADRGAVRTYLLCRRAGWLACVCSTASCLKTEISTTTRSLVPRVECLFACLRTYRSRSPLSPAKCQWIDVRVGRRRGYCTSNGRARGYVEVMELGMVIAHGGG